jgi:phosphate transport system substrate-binding protein
VTRCLLFFALLALGVSASLHAQIPLAGKLVSTGSDTLGVLSSQWAQTIMRDHPAVTVQVRAIGSSAAPTALVEGTADLGPMSRPMTALEVQAFTARFGYPPLAVPVAVDRLAVFVHRSNPLRRLPRRALDAMFSANRRCGAQSPLESWSELGLGERWQSRRITRYGRSAASGTYGFFRGALLCGGDYAPRVNRLVGSAAVVRAVGEDRDGIGYSSAGFLSDSVRELRILDDSDEALDLSRDLQIYVNLPPGEALPALVAAYLSTALSDAGQTVVSAAGYTPLARRRRLELRQDLGLAD